MADRVSDTIDIAAAAAEIFDVATDFDSYPEWNSNVKRAEVRETDADGRPTMVWFEVDAKLRTVTYTLAYDYARAPQAFSWDLVDGDVKELSGSYAFDEFEDVTEVTYELTVDPGFRIPGPLKRQGQRLILRGGLQGLKKRVEGT